MTVKLSLGPAPYLWSPERRRDHLARVADEAPVDEVHLGEVICSKRAPFTEAELPEDVERLERAGKAVVLASLAEVMLPRERKAIAAFAEIEDREIEINNAAGLYARGTRPHRVGPFLNVYNEATMAWMASRGATHVCLPAELPAEAIAVSAAAGRALGIGVEVIVFGRAPLAVSARCYHARAHGRSKDNCQFVCEEDPDGMPLATRDGRAILRINGIQTQSESYVSLLAEVDRLVGMGVTHLRLSPQAVDMAAVARVFRDRLDGRVDAEEGAARLAEICPDASFGNGFFHGAAGWRRIAAAAPA